MTANESKPKQTISILDTAVSELVQRLSRVTEQAERRVAELETKLEWLARGTTDVPVVAAAPDEAPRTRRRHAMRSVPPPVVARDTAAELERALRTKPAGIAELARTIGVPSAHVATALRGLKQAGKVYNVGTSEAPRWTWVVGDEAPTSELATAVETLLRDRPMTFAELLAATGSRRGRVSGVIVALQRGGAPIENKGSDRRARWFLPR